jgi:broad specificity phosphatase PhoE
MTRFYLIRHGMTENVRLNRLSGRAPGIHLNDQGEQEVLALAATLAHIKFDAIYSSPMERALQTAAPLSKALNIEAQIEDNFTEVDCGEWTGCEFHTLEQQPQFRRFNTFRSMTRIPGGESLLEVQARAVRGMEKLLNLHPEATIAVVSHGDVIRSLICFFAGIPLDFILRFEISPASYSIVDTTGSAVRILCLNRVPG